jgi:hypothetical protein
MATVPAFGANIQFGEFRDRALGGEEIVVTFRKSATVFRGVQSAKSPQCSHLAR